VLVAFLEVAGLASSDAVLPRGLTSLADRYHMVDGEVFVVERIAAVLALIEVTEIEILA
jgi:hypothetical protein